MLRFVVLFACIAACSSHAVVPLVVRAVHHAPLVAAYPAHEYAGYGLANHGLLGHEWVGKSIGHHVYKRSPHIVAPLAHGARLVPAAVAHVSPVAHLAPVAHVAPVAVSHQSRVDVHTSPAVVAAPILPVVKPVIAPVLHAAPVLHKSFITGPLGLGAGHYGHYASVYPHHGHY